MRRETGAIAPIFRTDTQARLLACLFLRPQETWTLASLARELGLSSSTLHPEVQRLEDTELVTVTQVGRARVLHANTGHPLARPLTEILEYVYGPRAVARLHIECSRSAWHESGPPSQVGCLRAHTLYSHYR